MKNFCKKIFFLGFIIIGFINHICVGDDIMSQVFEPAKNYESIIYIGNNKDTVGHTVLRERMSIDGSLIDGSLTVGIESKEPLIVRFVKFILRMTIVLSVTMVIFYSVKFLLGVFKGNDLKSSDAKKDIINLIIGLLIALFSITAVQLVVSIPKSSLNNSSLGYYQKNFFKNDISDNLYFKISNEKEYL